MSLCDIFIHKTTIITKIAGDSLDTSKIGGFLFGGVLGAIS
jgi:hypothetical protein